MLVNSGALGHLVLDDAEEREEERDGHAEEEQQEPELRVQRRAVSPSVCSPSEGGPGA